MDLTPVFKASIMAVKFRNKSGNVPDKNRILQKQNRDEFSKLSKDVCNKVTALKNLLIENRSAYMKFAAHLKNSAHMTDEQRDLIDRESEKFIMFYIQQISKMRNDWTNSNETKKQLVDHRKNVIEILSNYLKVVQNIYLEQKRYRMQYELETYRLLKLASDKKKIPIRPSFKQIRRRNSNSDEEEEEYNRSQTEESKLLEEYKSKERDQIGGQTSEEQKAISSQKVALDEDIQKFQSENYMENDLNPEDIQMFESENVQLFHELQGLTEELEQIEKNVVDIARLQEIFTEKVSLQKHDIERIANAVVGSTENVKDANEQIKQAIQRNAGLRVWALFFLLVMSFTLLFLDWYND